MAITNAEAKAINKMNVASQRVSLGTVIQSVQNTSGGSASGVWHFVNSDVMSNSPAPEGAVDGDFILDNVGDIYQVDSNLKCQLSNIKITAANIKDATAVGVSLVTAATAPIARTAIGAGTSSFSGSYTDLLNLPAAYTLPAANASTIGGVKQAVDQASSNASDVAGLVIDFNALLSKLKTAGIMA